MLVFQSAVGLDNERCNSSRERVTQKVESIVFKLSCVQAHMQMGAMSEHELVCTTCARVT